MRQSQMTVLGVALLSLYLLALPAAASDMTTPAFLGRWNLTPIDPPPIGNLHAIANSTGAATTYADNVPADGELDTKSAFFTSYGTNDRSCFACHAPRGGWSITPELAQFLFTATSGTDPMFRTNDGTTSPSADVSTLEAKRIAYHLLLTKGLIRVGLPLPKDAEFSLVAVDDPYHYASAAQLSLFRRPLPSVNLAFLSDLMWDGRQNTPGATLTENLANQADDATRTHAAATEALTAVAKSAIVNFESSVYLAQSNDKVAGQLNAAGALGGPEWLASLAKNVTSGASTCKAGEVPPFGAKVFSLYDAWTDFPGTTPEALARQSIARGEEIFNSRKFAVKGVRGFNDVYGERSITTTCSTCHNATNSGGNTAAMRMDLGISDAKLRAEDLPLYTLRNKRTGQVRQSSDPGRALISGLWQDVNCFKVPTLRALAARAPYFHNGAASTLTAVIQYLDQRFAIGLSTQEVTDLEAFLRVL